MYGSVFGPSDGMFDGSGPLARGGFIPMPLIITELAAAGRNGFAGRFGHFWPLTKE